MVKVVTLFLILMLILGIFGKLRMPRLPGPRGNRKVAAARKCPKCGTINPGRGPCPCGRDS